MKISTLNVIRRKIVIITYPKWYLTPLILGMYMGLF